MRYNYSCAKCGSSVSKPPVTTEKGKMVHGLHGWKCSSCGSGISVKRIIKPQD